MKFAPENPKSPCPHSTASRPSFSRRILLVLALHSFRSSLTNFQLVSAKAAGPALSREILADTLEAAAAVEAAEAMERLRDGSRFFDLRSPTLLEAYFAKGDRR